MKDLCKVCGESFRRGRPWHYAKRRFLFWTWKVRVHDACAPVVKRVKRPVTPMLPFRG